MARKKETFYAIAGGKMLAYGRPGQFGFPQGCLTKQVDKIEDAALFEGERQHKKLIAIVDLMTIARAALMGSVLYDWTGLKELINLGQVTICKLPYQPKRKTPKRPRLKLE